MPSASKTTMPYVSMVQRTTPLRRSIGIESLSSTSEVHLKLERHNATGTHKDRAANAIVIKALGDGFTGITAGSCGHFGAALAYHARLSGLRCKVFLPTCHDIHAVGSIRASGAEIEYVRGRYEQATASSQHFARESGYLDANPGGPMASIQIEAYKTIGMEIRDQLGIAPSSIWIPTGNGTLALGVVRGSPDRRTCFGVVGSKRNTSVVVSLVRGRCVELNPSSVNANEINSPLVNYASTHSEDLLAALHQRCFLAYGASDHELCRASRWLLQTEQLSCAPAGCAALAGFLAAAQDFVDTAGRHVLILTA